MISVTRVEPGPFGHEFSGIVVDKGKGVDRFRVGDSVMSVHSAPCLSCSYCEKGIFNLCENLMSRKMTDHGIAFRWSVEPETLELTADPDLMEQVMINLLLNAIRAVAGRRNPDITLSAVLSPEGKVIISVEDNGVGIVEGALENIFIPFFTTNKQGSGIGLSLSRQILRLHNATISAKSVADQGATFTLRFS